MVILALLGLFPPLPTGIRDTTLLPTCQIIFLFFGSATPTLRSAQEASSTITTRPDTILLSGPPKHSGKPYSGKVHFSTTKTPFGCVHLIPPYDQIQRKWPYTLICSSFNVICFPWGTRTKPTPNWTFTRGFIVPAIFLKTFVTSQSCHTNVTHCCPASHKVFDRKENNLLLEKSLIGRNLNPQIGN